MAMMKPFELTFELGSNITLRDSAIHMDGLLSNVCFRHTGCTEKALSMLDDLLLFNQDYGIYHASALAFGVTEKQSIVACTRHYVGNMRHGDDLRDETLQPTWMRTPARAERYRNVYIKGGPERQRLNKYQAYYSPYLVFHGVGDIARIERLVQFYCARIGVNANSGSGTVKQMAIKEIGQDFSFIDAHGQVARNLPCSFLQAAEDGSLGASAVGGLAALASEPLPVRAPYWKTHHRFSTVDAVAVEKVRRVVI